VHSLYSSGSLALAHILVVNSIIILLASANNILDATNESTLRD
jgi:hypothetical protein